MNTHVTATVKRIKAINWAGSFDKTPSRVALLREYLRRASWWASAVKATKWPFFDIAAAVSPKVRAAPAQVEAVEAHLSEKLQGGLVLDCCVRALHFAALLDAGTKLPRVPDSVALPFVLAVQPRAGQVLQGLAADADVARAQGFQCGLVATAPGQRCEQDKECMCARGNHRASRRYGTVGTRPWRGMRRVAMNCAGAVR
jgi:hypothetical protein